MRVALPTKDGQIFLQYDKAKEFTIYDVEIELVKSKEIVLWRICKYQIFWKHNISMP